MHALRRALPRRAPPALCAPRLQAAGARRQLAAMTVFDRDAKRRQRDRAALLPQPSQYDHVRSETAWQVRAAARRVRAQWWCS